MRDRDLRQILLGGWSNGSEARASSVNTPLRRQIDTISAAQIFFIIITTTTIVLNIIIIIIHSRFTIYTQSQTAEGSW